MKKAVIGYIFCNKTLTKEEKIFLRLAKKKNIKLILINLMKEIDEKEIEKKLEGCKIIYNNSAEEFATEIIKTLESLGKKVIESSEAYYYLEDKWLLFLKCRQNKIPTIETILLSEETNNIKKELLKWNKWPIILKRVEGTCGEYVERAGNIQTALKIIKKFWKKGSEKLPIIAQEFIKSPSYRLLLVDGKIIQTAIKKNRKSWKAIGVYGKKFERFEVDKNLKKIANRLLKMTKMKICGIDLLKKDDKWLILEINSAPGLDFFEKDRKMVINHILNLLKKESGLV